MKIKSKVMSLANGDEYSNVEFNMDDEYIQLFLPIKTEGQTVWINPELIASFDVLKTDQPLKYKKILREHDEVHAKEEAADDCRQCKFFLENNSYGLYQCQITKKPFSNEKAIPACDMFTNKNEKGDK